VWIEKPVRIEASDSPVDLTKLEELSESEVAEILRPAPVTPELLRTSRIPSDTTSRLGFVLGDAQVEVKYNRQVWHWRAFHTHAAIVGRLEASIQMMPDSGEHMLSPKLDVKLALMKHLSERKHSECFSCGISKIVSRDEANDHWLRGHVVWEYYDTKTNPVN
jgi:hypothetical protein